MKFLKTLPLFLLSFCTLSLSAQVTVDNTITVEELVNDYLLGEGVEATNITFNGMPGDMANIQIGLYEGESDFIDFDLGLVMASYDVVNVAGEAGGFITDPITDDPDLLAISGQPNFNDCAILEFDFVVQADSLKFNYVFASNEYPNYTCTQFNDAFGFFLSGPGISGPFTDDAINIALIPGTEIPVAINTVNGGAPTGTGTAATCEAANPNWIEDSQYFVENGLQPSGDVQFPGMTVNLQAVGAVQCGEEYHIKLAIGDAIDGILDSGVFLEGGSFQAFGALDISFAPQFNDGDFVFQDDLDSLAVAGCTGPFVSLTRPEGATVGAITFEYGGTATEGVDFQVDGDLPTAFPMGVDSLGFFIETINPNITDTLFLDIDVIYETCGGLDTVSTTIPIAPPVPIFTETEDLEIFCPTDSVAISVDATGGVEPFRYDWLGEGADEDGSGILVPIPETQQDFIVEVTDRCEFVFVFDTLTVINSIPPPLEASILPFDDPTCPNEPIQAFADISGGLGEYAIFWEDEDGDNLSFFDSVEVDYVSTTEIFFQVTDECGTQVRDSALVEVPEYDSLSVAITPLTDNCPNEALELSADISGGAGDYSVLWTWSTFEGIQGSDSVYTVQGTFTENPSFFEPTPGLNRVEVFIQDRCAREGFLFADCNNQFGFPYLSFECDTLSLPVVQLSPMQNVITPNNDGRNEVFVVPGINLFDNAEVLIYDRWGKMIYENGSYDAGTQESLPSQGFSADGYNDGTYFYIVRVNNGECVQQGNIEVLGGSE